ncbi:MAG: HlyC/CorC family transporter [Deltaproteobacteria bacterium]|nr:HlyC/CorC family transporter [Deltaproteobacteria bacterium]MBW2333552.1 HlyC/CorC family transporter [Deltaproteobacteria bacterium]
MKPTERAKTMLDLLLWLFIILVCIFFVGFFEGTEIAMVSVDQARIKALAEQGSKRQALLEKVLHTPEKFLSATLLGTNIFEVLSNAIATLLIINYLGEQYKYATILIMTPFILILGQIVPKTIYRYHAEQITPYLVYPLKVISIIFYPFVITLAWVTKFFVKVIGLESAQFRPHATREDLENYLDMWSRDSSLRTAEKKIVERIFDFSETEVEDVMIPLVNVEALEVNDRIEKAVSCAQKTGYSRIPVFSEEAYNIIGIVHAFDLLTAQQKTQTLRDIMRPAPYVPNTAPVDELLKQLRTKGNSIAIVVDEYGGTIGIVTIEDILEEVVGEIYDEYDKEEHFFVKIGKNKYLVNARMEIDELNDHLKLQLPKDDYETVGGFLLKHMEKIPRIGETFQFANLKFIITEADKRSIKKVSITIRDNKEKVEETEIQ